MCDIEGGEWDAIAGMDDKELNKIDQMSIEAHTPILTRPGNSLKMFEERAELIRKVKRHFVLYHTHINNGGGMRTVSNTAGDGINVPQLFQLSFVNKIKLKELGLEQEMGLHTKVEPSSEFPTISRPTLSLPPKQSRVDACLSVQPMAPAQVNKQSGGPIDFTSIEDDPRKLDIQCECPTSADKDCYCRFKGNQRPRPEKGEDHATMDAQVPIPDTMPQSWP